ncbi:ATPase, T2SS/T4P/T4SS family [Bengtsoniella intestinalis]|uniref:GspE/PulE family protein n=1 Tax=Bengtsoniella intestinalis TaxID=3073143 RepID=UPI00391F06F8
MKTNQHIGDVMISHGFITYAQLSAALAEQASGNSKRIGEILREQKLITEHQLLIALGERLSLPVIDITQYNIDLAVMSTIPKILCQKYCMIAISATDSVVTLVVNDPLDFYAIEDLKSFFDKQCELLICERAAILDAINRSYSEVETRSVADVASGSFTTIDAVVEDFSVSDEHAPIVNLVNSIVIKGYLEGASDIHFEPFERHFQVRLRVDGQLLDYMDLEKGLSASMTTRIKILADLDIAERRIPQDGNFKLLIEKKPVGIRVSTIPTPFGEKLVLRFLSREVALDNAEHYGMSPQNYEKIAKILKNPYGMIYITGPTGSGKTTTLYMIVEELAKHPINVSTIEDPVERSLPRVNQTQVNPKAGFTFQNGLRALLRQDPDVILLGETRDSESAQIAVSAAITGHLVLSTLHTNDAISSIVRLKDMGVPSYLVANSLVGVVAQRLVKKVCPICKETYQATDRERAILPSATTLVRGKGCNACGQSGYKGRIAVHEIVEMDRAIRSMVADNAPSGDIYSYVHDKGDTKTIADNIAELVLSGVTSMEEYEKNAALII